MATRIVRVGVVVILSLVLAASGAPQAPAKADDDIFGLATRHGVCAKPALASKLGVPSELALRLVPPYADLQGENSGLTVDVFKGVALVVIEAYVKSRDATLVVDRLVQVDVTWLTPCADDDRWRCATDRGNAMLADGEVVESRPGDRYEVHALWRFAAYGFMWVTDRVGRAAELRAPVARC